MAKYDGPSYHKGQKRSNKSKFPFYRDSVRVTKKDNLFDRTKTSKFEQPVKISKEISAREPENLFSEFVNQNNLERKQRLGQTRKIAVKKKEAVETNQLSDQKTTKKFLKEETSLVQNGRSSTPFKVQKIPSPYYGFQQRNENDDFKINYKKIAGKFKKEAGDFILLADHLSSTVQELFAEKQSSALIKPSETNVVVKKAEDEKQPVVSSHLQKRTLRRSLAGMIEEDQNTQLNHGKNVSSYFIKSDPVGVSESIEKLNAHSLPAGNIEAEAKSEQPPSLNQENEVEIAEAKNEKTTQEKQQETNIVQGNTQERSPEEIEMLEIEAALSRLRYLDQQTFNAKPSRQTEPQFAAESSNTNHKKENMDQLPAEDHSTKDVTDFMEESVSQENTLIETQSERIEMEMVDPEERIEKEDIILAENEPETDSVAQINELILSETTSLIEEQETGQEDKNSAFIPATLLTSELEEEALRTYQFPPVELFNPPVEFQSNAVDDWVLGQAELLNETLDAFNVNAQVVGWTVGPAVTQFELQLGRGVKVNKITNLSDDLKLSLAAKDIRIEAPIPGKSTVGVEIPNRDSRPVMLSEVMGSEKFSKSTSPLTVAIGVNLSGEAIVSTLDKMPHGLIAGATGSGKSVFINSILVSLLYKAKPSEVKMILIDPKAVELAPYNAIPHLLSPVISEPKAASEALKWAVNEMEERYQKLAAAGVRNIQRFNEKAEKRGEYGLKLPYIVIVIDELADLMMVASNDVQDSIARITQKARAAGIHLLVATQRPSVDVITGTIKNNIPTRVAFMVSSQVDSRTIMDTGGAEKLLGRGDMLFLENGASQPIRIQGTYVEKEIDSIVQHVKEQRKTSYLFEPETLLSRVEAIEGKDELYDEILSFIIDEGQVSASSLQRKFKIGFNRASNLIETLESENLISGNKGSKPRDVFITKSDYEAYQL
ncbi:DNA translocase FtsK [Carnobacterium sp.]|uniref:DNA translocase FtsK n=1 Tax=Carnobacterium sp. TaxID=48221 RepID=UPI0028A9EAF9|nr:DNA translocase FtsK [Carnobacterium sp.]